MRKCVGHNHDKDGDLLPPVRDSEKIGEDDNEIADNAELSSNSPVNDEEDTYTHKDNVRLK